MENQATAPNAPVLPNADKINELECRLAALEEIVVGMTTPAKKEAKSPLLSGETFAHKGKKYRLRYPAFTLDGKPVKETDVLSDKKLQARLVEEAQGLLVVVE